MGSVPNDIFGTFCSGQIKPVSKLKKSIAIIIVATDFYKIT